MGRPTSTEHHPRSGCSNPAPRTLHTFVPLPVSSTPSTMVSHGGIPTHMVLNPEPGKENNIQRMHITHEKKRDTATSKSTLAILLHVWAIHQHRFMKPPSGADQYQISLVRPLEPQYLFRFGQNKDPGHGSVPFRPWTDIEDQELISLKNDTISPFMEIDWCEVTS